MEASYWLSEIIFGQLKDKVEFHSNFSRANYIKENNEFAPIHV